MTKKEYIIYVLKELWDSWKLSKWFLKIVQNLGEKDELLDKLYLFFKDNIDLKNKENMIKSLEENKKNFRKNLEEEKNDLKQENKELKEIENYLLNL